MPKKQATNAAAADSVTASDKPEIGGYLEPLTKMAPKKNGVSSKVIETGDYLRESLLRQQEAGVCLKEFILTSPDSLLWERFNDLTPGQRECIQLASPLRSLEAVVLKRVREFERKAEEERKRNRKTRPYPSVSRRAHDTIGSFPEAPFGVSIEGRG